MPITAILILAADCVLLLHQFVIGPVENFSLFKICFKISQVLFKNVIKRKVKLTQNLLQIFSTFFQFAFFQILRKFS